jgi:curved DNA-binding protein CbpA
MSKNSLLFLINPSPHQTKLLLFLSALLLALSNTARAQPEEDQKSQQDDPPWLIEGYLDFRYTLQSNDDDIDQDLYQTLSLTFSETESRWISGYISGRMSQDLDGSDHPDSFVSIPDSHDRFYARLNYAYVDFRPEWKLLEVARVGRQWLSEVSEIVRMDGLRLESQALEHSLQTKLILYGGVPEHLGESSRSQDRLYGIGLEVRPWKMARLSAAYTRLKDVYKQEWVDNTNRISARDDLLSFELRQNMFENTLIFYGAYSNLNSESRETRMKLAYESEDGHWGTSLRYRILHSTQNSQSTELDPYVSVLRSYHPYQEITFNLRRDLSKMLTADAGASIRRMDKERDKGAFNHDFERYFLSGTFQKWPLQASEVTVAGNLYDADGDRFWEIEGSWQHDFTDSLRTVMGTGYALYHEDRYTLEERNHVRSGFLRLNYDWFENVLLQLNYTINNDDEETTHMWEVGLQYRF